MKRALHPRMRARLAFLFVPVLALAACGGTADPNAECGARCDIEDDFRDQITGSDPIADWLRQSEVSATGVLDIDYATLLEQLAAIQGCDPGATKTFVVSDDLLSTEPFPRLVSVLCTDDDVKVTDVFVAASFERFEGGEPTGEIDTRAIEMFAWDDEARSYRFYATEPVFDSATAVKVELEPARCRQCHTAPADAKALAMPMIPIMNELSRPWTHWNASPGFPSHNFSIPDRARNSESYPALATGCIQDDGSDGPCSASVFEGIIREAHDQVVGARTRKRRNPANVAETMSLLRPLFCPEQVNYATEDFESGVITNAVLIDPGLRNMFKAVRPDDWPWSWLNDDIIRLGSLDVGEDPVTQVPVRGNVDQAYENRLVALRALTPTDVLQVRALDWKRPVFSEFRCGLWRDAQARFLASPPDVSGFERNLDLMPVLLRDILTLNGAAITAGAEEQVVALDLATAESVAALEDALASGGIDTAVCGVAGEGFCIADLNLLGDMIQTHVDDIVDAFDNRDILRSIRDARVCHVTEVVAADPDRFDEGSSDRFANRPSLPDVSCFSSN